MAEEELVTLAKFSDAQEASMIAAMLDSHGIRGVTVGGEINNTLWHLGPTIAGVALQVPAPEANRAQAVLDEFRTSEPDGPQSEWTCLECGEQGEAGFQVCWSCGTPFDEGNVNAAPIAEHDEKSAPGSANATQPKVETPEELVDRAWRAAKLGIVFFPAAAYSFSLLLQLDMEQLSEPAMKKYYWSRRVAWGWLAILMLVLGDFLFNIPRSR